MFEERKYLNCRSREIPHTKEITLQTRPFNTATFRKTRCKTKESKDQHRLSPLRARLPRATLTESKLPLRSRTRKTGRPSSKTEIVRVPEDPEVPRSSQRRARTDPRR